MKVPRFVTFLLLGFVVLGVGLLVASAFAYRSTRTLLAGAAASEGTIVAYAESRDQEGRLSYYPVVSFSPKDGQRVEFQARTGGSSRGPLGEPVAVLYDPRNPHEAAINSFFSLWFAPLLLLALGLGFAGIGAALLVAFGRPAGSRGDIRVFFDAICHGWLGKFLEHRIADRRVLRLVQKWLRAGPTPSRRHRT